MRRAILLCTLALGILAVALPKGPRNDVDAGTAVRLDIPELVNEAELVLEGRIRSQRVVESAPRRVETEYTIEVDRWFTAEGGTELRVRIPGGVLPDGSGLLIPGMPRIQEGEEVLLFLSEAGSTGVRMPVGLSQGKFRVERSLSGARSLSRRHGSLTTIDAVTGVSEDAGGSVVYDYAEVVAEIHAAVERKGDRR